MLSGRYRSRTLLKVAWNIQPWLHLRMGIFGSASFHKAKKFWYSFRAPEVSGSGTYWITGVSRKIFRSAHWHTCSSHGHWLGLLLAGRVTKSASTSPVFCSERWVLAVRPPQEESKNDSCQQQPRRNDDLPIRRK